MIEVEEPITKKESSYGIQDYLSIGYIFLLILGVLHEAIYYKFLDVNIFDYTSVLDVLISPISVITGDFKLLIGLVICVLVALLYAKLIPKYYDWLSKKEKYQSGKKKEKIDKLKNKFKSGSKHLLLLMVGLYIIGGFVGFGIGRGGKIKSRITNGDIRITHQLTFDDGETKNIQMLGKNSLYVFYVTKENSNVTIVPIDGNIKTIRKIDK